MLLAVEDYPRDLLELEVRFSTEAACREYLFHLPWHDRNDQRAADPEASQHRN